MRVGSLAPIGDPDSAVRRDSSATLTAPASDRLCDIVVVGFALWTLSSHAVVAAGGGLVALLILSALVFAASLALWLRFGARPSLPEPTGPAELADATRSALWMLRIVSLVAGIAIALRFVVRPDVFQMWWSAVVLLGIAAVAVCFRDAARISPPERGRSAEMLLWLLAVAGVAVALISHRPDADDAFYVNVAVAAADIPGQALLSVDTLHGIPGLPLYLPVYRVASYEILNGALAYLTGIPAIYFFHWVSASIAALLVPLAHAKLFRILTPRRWLASVATLVFILLAAGETHRWYGNFSFVRIWQGKAILLSVFLPLVYAYGLRFAARPTLRDWAMLAAAQIAAVGCSSSALWVAPAGALMALASAAPLSRRGLKTVILGTLASVYVLAAAWFFQTSLEGSIGVPLAGGSTFGPQLRDALVNALGDSRLLFFGIVSLLTGWVFASPGLARRFAIVFPLAVLLGLLNPYTARWVTANVTGPPYWRTMWALPLPIVMALMLTSPLHLGGGSSRPVTRRAVWLVLLAAFAFLVPRYSGLSPENNVRLSWPQLKVPDVAYQWAVDVNASVPPGSHVAVPTDIGTWIVTRHHHVYPLLVRYYLHTWRTHLSTAELLDRMAIQRFLDAPELVEATPEQFRDALDRFELRAVCLVNTPRARTARSILQGAGFSKTLVRKGYELWVRPGAGPNVRPDGEER